VFSVDYRDLVRERVLQMAASDPRIVAGAVVGSLDRDELLWALAAAIEGLLQEVSEVGELAIKVESQLRQLAAPLE
jgi:hypothetical protein